MDRQQLVNRLDFENQVPLNHYIQPVPAIELYSLVNDRQRHLTGEVDPTLLQLEAQTFLISRFQKTRPEFPMHANCETDDAIGQWVSRRIVELWPEVGDGVTG